MTKLSEQAILRRIDFLLSEAKCDPPMTKRDQAITFVMRVVSNHCTVEEDAGSARIKKLNARMSHRAFKLSKKLSHEKWVKGTINEHPEPLEQTWKWILAHHKKLSREKVLERFKLWRMVTVTHKEDEELRKRKYRNKGPIKRYEGIEVGRWEGDKWGAFVSRKFRLIRYRFRGKPDWVPGSRFARPGMTFR